MIADGIPRVINTLCDLSLVYGFSAASKTIDLEIVNEVAHDRNKMGLSTSGDVMSETSLISGVGGSSVGKH
jgi:hypothetical protein